MLSGSSQILLDDNIRSVKAEQFPIGEDTSTMRLLLASK